MQTSGQNNDSLIILVPAGAIVIVGVIVFGGPMEAIEAISSVVRDVASQAVTLGRAWF